LTGILITAILFTVPAFSIQDAYAGVPLIISDEASCESIPGAVWSSPPDTCTLTSSYAIAAGPGWIIAAGVTLVINSGVTLTSDSNIENFGTIDVFGTIQHLNARIDNHGIINIYGTVDNGVSGNIENFDGVINIICDAVFTGDPIQGNPPNIIPCPPPEPPVVGGEVLAINNIALLISGVSLSAVWMIPTLAGLAGAGVYLVKFRTNKK